MMCLNSYEKSQHLHKFFFQQDGGNSPNSPLNKIGIFDSEMIVQQLGKIGFILLLPGWSPI